MPLFYFDVRDGEFLAKDPEGTELPDIEAALVEAQRVARELAIEDLKQGIPIDGRLIEILDQGHIKKAEYLVRRVLG